MNINKYNLTGRNYFNFLSCIIVISNIIVTLEKIIVANIKKP